MECPKCKEKLVIPAGKSSPAAHECAKPKKPKKKVPAKPKVTSEVVEDES